MKVSREEFLKTAMYLCEHHLCAVPLSKVDIFGDEVKELFYEEVGIDGEFYPHKKIKKAVVIFEVPCTCLMRKDFLKAFSKYVDIDSVVLLLYVKSDAKKVRIFYI